MAVGEMFGKGMVFPAPDPERGRSALTVSFLGALAIGYLLGSIPFGYLMGRLKGIDVRRYGSGATGGTNVQRTLGWGPAVITGLSDLLKGTLAAYIGFRLAGDWGYVAAGIGAVAGHSYPVWLNFRGGKSVATGGGVFVLLHWPAVLLALAMGLAVVLPTRYVSLGSIMAALSVVGYMFFFAPPEHKYLALAVVALILWRHRTNMQRLLAGTENKFGQKARPRTEQ